MASEQNEILSGINSDYAERFGWSVADTPLISFPKGISEAVVRQISEIKDEPGWMTDFRIKSYHLFESKPLPPWISPFIHRLDWQDIHYYVRSTEKSSRSWEDLPDNIKETYDRLGIPEAERNFLAGSGAQFESESAYHNLREDLEAQGVIFLDMDSALREHPELVRKYWATVVPPADNKLAALNSAVWSGGSFLYVPEGVEVDRPLSAYFRINAESMGQFERTLIIAEPGSKVHYSEGCSAPLYSSNSLHSAVVEIIAEERSNVQYTTLQNWASGSEDEGGVFNLVTKRAKAMAHATMRWSDVNLGSTLTSKYPSIYLLGEHAHGEILSIAWAGPGQHQDAGGKIIHGAPHTTSEILSKSISSGGGRATYRGLLEVAAGAEGARSRVVCDALLLDEHSRSDTYPTIRIGHNNVDIGHEATTTKVGEEQIFYLRSRGISEAEATQMIVNGFIEPVVKTLPMEYAVEMNRLIELQMEGSVG